MRTWGVWSVITAVAAMLVSSWIAVQTYLAWAAGAGRGPRDRSIEDAFDFAFAFGGVLLGWIVAAVVFVLFVAKARGSGAGPGRGLVGTWVVATVLAVYFGLIYLVYMNFATPNRRMEGETLIYAGANIAVAFLVAGLVVTATLLSLRPAAAPTAPEPAQNRS